MSASPYWQHQSPLSCPKGHEMIWLGSCYWICPKGGCNKVYVQLEPTEQQIRWRADSSSEGPAK